MNMTQTTFDEFVDLSRRGTFVPVCREIMADLLTPVSAFLKIAEHSDYAFLLESVEGGEHIGRYSFLGKDPFMVVRGREGRTTIEQAGVQTSRDEPFIDVLRGLMGEFQAPFVPHLPRFTGGAVGYFDYDAAEWFEPTTRLEKPLPDRDQSGFMMFDTVLAFDHVKHRILAIANARLRPGEDLRALYDFAAREDRFPRARARTQPLAPRAASVEAARRHRQSDTRAIRSAVKTIQGDIAAGEVFQAVISQRFDARTDAPPFDVYRALRHINPSPYMFFLRMGQDAIIGASPEMLVRVEGRHVETHPIAGTRRRGATPDEDQRLAEELRRNEKERAEHVMLVDLGRNDIGRVSEIGSVRVPQFMALERYSHVMHLVSRVEGQLAEDRDRLDALVATFPAGTLTGAPKIRAMQIVGALEPTRRGLYGGAVGYLDFAGNLDFCIAIRTIAMHGTAARGPGRRRHRRRLAAGRGVRRDLRQSACASPGPRNGRQGHVAVVLIIDNYDSFTFNLAHRLGELGAETRVIRNDAKTLDEIEAMQPSRLVISPGPGRPETAGVSVEALRRFAGRIPVLGVCLGHQALAIAFGGRVERAPVLMHGKTSKITHDGTHLFTGLANPFDAGRYHSLVIPADGLPTDFVMTASVTDEGTVMGVRHSTWPVYGVQFHPESVLTAVGHRILQNFLEAH